ncbi:Molybdopterin synthase catalytic subunit, partial [Diplodia seriata]
ALKTHTGTTRSTFDSKPVARLSYQSYAPLALATLLALAREVRARHALTAVAVVHRLGPVPVGEESVLVAVSSPHRQAAWRGGEDALELTKERAEIWKLEEFVGDEEGAVWRANRDGKAGVRVGNGAAAVGGGGDAGDGKVEEEG